MSQETPGVKLSYEASDSLPAQRVVAINSDRTCKLWDTSTSFLAEVNQRLVDSGAAADVILTGTAKVQCFASVSFGALVAPATGGSGKIQAVTVNTSTSFPQILGVALESGSTDASIEVLLGMERRQAGL